MTTKRPSRLGPIPLPAGGAERAALLAAAGLPLRVAGSRCRVDRSLDGDVDDVLGTRSLAFTIRGINDSPTDSPAPAASLAGSGPE